ncbi:hypothetical protein LEMLEM_LOCUS20035 [Lemmus lemmus]
MAQNLNPKQANLFDFKPLSGDLTYCSGLERVPGAPRFEAAARRKSSRFAATFRETQLSLISPRNLGGAGGGGRYRRLGPPPAPSPASFAPRRPQRPGLFLRRRVRPTFISPGQGSGQVSAGSPVRPGPGRPSPPLHGGPWAPASGDGRGPRRPPPRRLGLGRRVSPTRGAGSGLTCRGQWGSWTAAAGPRAGAAAAGARPRGPRGRSGFGMRQGGDARRGGCGRPARPDAGSRGPGSPLSTRPSLPPPFCLPLRVAAAAAVVRRGFPGCGHFPASLARGPRTGASGRPAGAGSERWAGGLSHGCSPAAPSTGEHRLRARRVESVPPHSGSAPRRDPGATLRAWVPPGKGGERRSETTDVWRQDV